MYIPIYLYSVLPNQNNIETRKQMAKQLVNHYHLPQSKIICSHIHKWMLNKFIFWNLFNNHIIRFIYYLIFIDLIDGVFGNQVELLFNGETDRLDVGEAVELEFGNWCQCRNL
jgi:hypothetical protein